MLICEGVFAQHNLLRHDLILLRCRRLYIVRTRVHRVHELLAAIMVGVLLLLVHLTEVGL